MLGGAGLLFARTAPIAIRILLPYLLLWMSLRIPFVLGAPQVEVNWPAVAEVAVLVAGAWALFADLCDHFFYWKQTVALVPAWLPFRIGWAYLTGVGHTAAGLGVLFSVFPGLAASMEAAMLTIFTVLVWIPAIVAAPATQSNGSELVISFAISAAAWVVAGSLGAESGGSPSGRGSQ